MQFKQFLIESDVLGVFANTPSLHQAMMKGLWNGKLPVPAFLANRAAAELERFARDSGNDPVHQSRLLRAIDHLKKGPTSTDNLKVLCPNCHAKNPTRPGLVRTRCGSCQSVYFPRGT